MSWNILSLVPTGLAVILVIISFTTFITALIPYVKCHLHLYLYLTQTLFRITMVNKYNVEMNTNFIGSGDVHIQYYVYCQIFYTCNLFV
jgi:hypothetical protein